MNHRTSSRPPCRLVWVAVPYDTIFGIDEWLIEADYRRLQAINGDFNLLWTNIILIWLYFDYFHGFSPNLYFGRLFFFMRAFFIFSSYACEQKNTNSGYARPSSGSTIFLRNIALSPNPKTGSPARRRSGWNGRSPCTSGFGCNITTNSGELTVSVYIFGKNLTPSFRYV